MTTPPNEPIIYVVATPIGNLEDISARTIRILQEVDFIAAEDTRTTKNLLNHLGILKKEIVSYHDHSEKDQAEKLVARLKQRGETLALISEAGTPAISDPGYRLVARAHAENIRVCPIPGPSALPALVSASGLPSSRLLFVGFLPVKANALAAEMKTWTNVGATVVFYESARRLEKTLSALSKIFPDAQICIGRELTKLYEQVATMPVAQALPWVAAQSVFKGEVSVAVDLGAAAAVSAEEQAVLLSEKLRHEARQALSRGESLKSLLVKYKNHGLSRSDLYQLLLSVKDGNN